MEFLWLNLIMEILWENYSGLLTILLPTAGEKRAKKMYEEEKEAKDVEGGNE